MHVVWRQDVACLSVCMVSDLSLRCNLSNHCAPLRSHQCIGVSAHELMLSCFLCSWQAIKQHPSALQLYREKLGKEGMVSKEQVSLLTF